MCYRRQQIEQIRRDNSTLWLSMSLILPCHARRPGLVTAWPGRSTVVNTSNIHMKAQSNLI